MKPPKKRFDGTRSRDEVLKVLRSFLSEDLHASRILSLANATVGVLVAGSLAVHAIGAGLARAAHLQSKHSTKQVDRLLSNEGIDTWELFAHWVPWILGNRKEIVVALDWTEFAKDGHSTIALYLLTEHGRATPLLWSSVESDNLKGIRNDCEDLLLQRLHEVLPSGVSVTVVADRGFSDVKLFHLLSELGFHYIIRTRSNIHMKNGDEVRMSRDWVSRSGRATKFRNVKVTAQEYEVAMAVTVHDKRMKEPWLLLSDLDISPKEAIGYYGKRFTIEEGFRDLKDPRYGMGLSSTRISRIDRRDRLILIASFALALLTLLGEAGEQLGMDKQLKVNTAKKRTMSLVRQGKHWFDSLPFATTDRLDPLFLLFSQLVANIPFCNAIFSVL